MEKKEKHSHPKRAYVKKEYDVKNGEKVKIISEKRSKRGRKTSRTKSEKRNEPAPKREPNYRPRHRDSTIPKMDPKSTVEKEALQEIVEAKVVELQQKSAKLVPGVLPVKFEVGGNIIDTVPITSSSARTMTTCFDLEDNTSKAIGTKDFVLLMICAPYTLFYGSGTTNQMPFTTKIGGLMIA